MRHRDKICREMLRDILEQIKFVMIVRSHRKLFKYAFHGFGFLYITIENAPNTVHFPIVGLQLCAKENPSSLLFFDK